MSTILETKNLWKAFGGLIVTKNVNLKLAPGARHALIGPNGSGKTTLINQLTGVLRPSSGSVWLDGEEITRMAPNDRVYRGLSRTFQINTLFPRLTPLEAVVNTICVRERKQLNILRRRVFGISNCGTLVDEAYALLEQLNLADDCLVETHTLAYGKQRLLEMALALATKPKVLLLDEPAAGVPEGESDELFEVLNALPKEISILLIEHDMNLVFNFADSITVLVSGEELVTGTPAEIADDPRVREVYLGKGH
jgi:ABC-type branched-subunit amino acid transport system ATPase component